MEHTANCKPVPKEIKKEQPQYVPKPKNRTVIAAVEQFFKARVFLSK